MAATSVISCPHCAKKFKGRPELQGKTVKCPACTKPFVVTAIATDRVEADSKKEAQAVKPVESQGGGTMLGKAAAWDEDLDEDGNPYGVTDLDIAPRCPHCAKEMESATALICLHCGYNTQTRSMGSTKKTIAHTGADYVLHLLPGIACAAIIVILVVGNLWNCFYWSEMAQGSDWMPFFDHESVRLWSAIISLALIWGLGMFGYKRLILEPTPEEKVLD
jgi:hypothetical protein